MEHLQVYIKNGQTIRTAGPHTIPSGSASGDSSRTNQDTPLSPMYNGKKEEECHPNGIKNMAANVKRRELDARFQLNSDEAFL